MKSAKPVLFSPPIRIATWNVQSARLLTRRKLVDEICLKRDIDLLCLQDARFYNGSFSTNHYEWIPSQAFPAVCPKFGCFLLLRKKANFQHHQFMIHLQGEESFVVCAIRRHSQFFFIVNAYLPCNGTQEASSSYELLANVIEKLKRSHPGVPIYLCGDFNAHLGFDLRDDPDMAGLVGPNLLHLETNENGGLLAGISHSQRLGTVTTLFSSSTLVTRTSGSTQSQLDHILIYEDAVQHVINLYGEWQPFSDHKLIVMDIVSPTFGMFRDSPN